MSLKEDSLSPKQQNLSGPKHLSPQEAQKTAQKPWTELGVPRGTHQQRTAHQNLVSRATPQGQPHGTTGKVLTGSDSCLPRPFEPRLQRGSAPFCPENTSTISNPNPWLFAYKYNPPLERKGPPTFFLSHHAFISISYSQVLRKCSKNILKVFIA